MSNKTTITASSDSAENKIRVIDDLMGTKRVRGPNSFEHPEQHYYQRIDEGVMMVIEVFDSFGGVANRMDAIKFAKSLKTIEPIVEVWAIPSPAPAYAVGELV